MVDIQNFAGNLGIVGCRTGVRFFFFTIWCTSPAYTGLSYCVIPAANTKFPKAPGLYEIYVAFRLVLALSDIGSGGGGGELGLATDISSYDCALYGTIIDAL